MVIGAADMKIQTVGLAGCGDAPASQREDGCVEVTYWVYPEDVENAKPSFARAADMVDSPGQNLGVNAERAGEGRPDSRGRSGSYQR